MLLIANKFRRRFRELGGMGTSPLLLGLLSWYVLASAQEPLAPKEETKPVPVPWTPPEEYSRWVIKPEGWSHTQIHKAECKQGQLLPSYPMYFHGYVLIHAIAGIRF